jgi:hypothetical protein
MLIEFRCHGPQLGQIIPWDAGKIVMFDVVAHVKVGNIHPTHIVVCLHFIHKLVVLCVDVQSHRMWSNG